MLSASNRAMMSGWRSTSFRPALSFLTISGDVPVGTNTPFHS